MTGKQRLSNTPIARDDQGKSRQLINMLDVLLRSVLFADEVLEGGYFADVDAWVARLESLKSR